MSHHERRATPGDPLIDLDNLSAGAAAGYYEIAVRQMRAGQHAEAEEFCQRVLALDPAHANALHLMGILAFHAGRHDLAVEWAARAVKLVPRTEYLSTLGTALQHLGRREEALKAFDKAVQTKPDDAELWINLGNVLVELQRPSDAVLSFQHALKLNPRLWDAANKSGRLLYHLGRWAEALVHFNQCDELQPDHAPTLRIRAICLRQLRRFEHYLADNQRAHALDPTDADTCNNIGDALQSLGREEEALHWFDEALGRAPDNVKILNNKAFSLSQLQRFDEAFAVYDRSKTIDPHNAATSWNSALLHMLLGDFEAGWAGREARWRATELSTLYPRFTQPMWLGAEAIDGKTILIHVDEGLGDSIQFARYVPMVAALRARVILVVADSLCPLLSGLPGVALCLPLSARTLPAFDYHCPISSLPLAFGTRLDTIPSATRYLPLPEQVRRQAWEARLGPHDRLRVGLAWSGSLGHKNDHNRSIPLWTLSSILDVNATFVSLQKDPRPDDRTALLARTDIIDLTADLADFRDTAALVSCLDLVITVDTSVAHLAGALGCPTWILLPYTPDYRWLLDRDDSPWYPTARLFRQTETRDYAGVLDRVRAELLTLAAAS